MKQRILNSIVILLIGITGYAEDGEPLQVSAPLELADGWKAEEMARIDQSYAAWDVEIGDANNDGRNEVLITGAPNSRLYLLTKETGKWHPRLLAEDLAQRGHEPGMGLSLRIDDLNQDGVNEIILGTGQEAAEPAYCYVLQTDGKRITKRLWARPSDTGSVYTHSFGICDIDNDGIKEIISAYCGSGEIVRYDASPDLSSLASKTIFQNTGSGEDSRIADVDNDGAMEYITADCYRDGQAQVRIFEFDKNGELETPARIVIDECEGEKCFHCTFTTGDIDNDGLTELIVEWKKKQNQHQGSLLGYRIDAAGPQVLYTFGSDDPGFDLSYAENMMHVADADNDGQNELIVSTRGEKRWGGQGLARLYMFKVGDGSVHRTILADFQETVAESCWCAVGDADNDSQNEIVIVTGAGRRDEPGLSYVFGIEKQ